MPYFLGLPLPMRFARHRRFSLSFGRDFTGCNG
jgi:hypothetical protein